MIKDSDWINELKEIDKNHPYFNEDKWNSLNHYVTTFHDDLFECIAKGFEITNDINFDKIVL